MNDRQHMQIFEEARPRLLGLAYRILGSRADAEDAVQDTFLKWQEIDRAAIETPAAWLTTACTRRCLDLLKAAHRKPDLLVFAYGGNDLQRVADGDLKQDKYVAEYTALVKKVRAGRPEASCMILGITERKQSKGRLLDTTDMRTIVDGQRETAEATGCAFFDMYTAMGGKGSFRKWQKHKPSLVKDDGIHLSHEGNEKMGGWIFDALMSGYASQKKK